ncbi:nicotinamide riboside transporter PnuC [Oenococcus alcoholitolerans]|uniref:nicotinamide riboside transporter PnuC n=1 Tax=Oenococcus alcoholitolerans TaxID=931074 RepID=UPI003F7187FA
MTENVSADRASFEQKNNNGLHEFWFLVKKTFNFKYDWFELVTLKKATLILLFGLLAVQIGSFLFADQYNAVSYIGLFTGVTQIISLILCDQGRITTYFWESLSAGAWLITDIENRLIGDIYSQVFYFVMQFVGIYVWGKRIDRQSKGIELKSRKMTWQQGLFWFFASLVIYAIVLYTSKRLNGTQIYLDATLLPLGIVGQVLMTYGYRSQWIAWIALDVINVIVWFNQLKVSSPASLSMLVLQVLMTVNAVYGAYMWFFDKDQN